MKKSKKKIIVFTIIIFVLIVGYFSSRNKNEQDYNFVIAERSNISQEVNVTGQVKPTELVDLGLETGGKVKGIYVKIGDKVIVGQLLVALDGRELDIQILQLGAELESAQANLAQYRAAADVQQAKLDELNQGSRPEEIQITETKVINAREILVDAQNNLENVRDKADIDLLNLYNDVEDILYDSYSKADSAVNEQMDEMFSNDSSDSPELTFFTSDSQGKIDVEQQRKEATETLISLKDDLGNVSLETDFLVLDSFLTNTRNNLLVVRVLLNNLNDVVNSAINLSQTILNTYKSSISTAQTNINTALSNINSQEQLIASQRIVNQNNIATAQSSFNAYQSALSLAEDELILGRLGATDEQVKAQEALVSQAKLNVVSQQAQVKRAQANLESINIQLLKMELHSPSEGIITEQEAKIGEIISANIPFISVMSDNNFKVEANVPEVDIAKININDSARIRLDAYESNVVFEANLTNINPAETVIEGVSTYKVTLYFTKEDKRIKSGMTADIDILTDERQDIIAIPLRAVFGKNGDKFVRVVDSEGVISEIEVETGLKGTLGQIEITKGIVEGDKVITILREK